MGTFENFQNKCRQTFCHKVSWERRMIKSKARIGVIRNLTGCIIVALILAVMTKWCYYLYDPVAIFIKGWSGFMQLRGIRVVLLILFTILSVALFGPMEIGCRRFFVENEKGNRVTLSEIKYVFVNPYYFSEVLVMLVRNLAVLVGSVFLIVPGFYINYCLKLVPYLLAEQPSMKLVDAFKLSNNLMKGQKWDAFVLDLSFWPWALASTMTFGLAGLLFGWPYHQAAKAELYLEILSEQYGKVR